MVAKVITVAPIGVEGALIEVEGDATKSLPSLQIVGLGNKAIDEAKERVRSAISNSMLEFPKKRITINLAPAELPKDGAHYDVPIALAILCISGQIQQRELNDAVFAGELALDGTIRPIKGAINITEAAKNAGYSRVFLPSANVEQACLIDNIEIYAIDSIAQLYLHLKKEAIIQPYATTPQRAPQPSSHPSPSLDDIYGQEQAKRALVIAAAGHHNILLSGSPGAGKTMLAKALVNLLPPLAPPEQIEATKIHSLVGKATGEIIYKRPFRSPHHTSSHIALVGGGTSPKPGEISLAHTGVLFLDEMPEYTRSTLEALRQPLEDKKIDVSRAGGHASYPADFMLVGTMNPCPCGYFGDSTKECSCTTTQILAYQKRLSGPLLDRIDLTVHVSRVSNETLLQQKPLNNNQHLTASELINTAVDMQIKRYKSSVIYNASLTSSQVRTYAPLSVDGRSLLLKAANSLALSARSYFKIIKVSRTIADLEGIDDILPRHISEALQYRG